MTFAFPVVASLMSRAFGRWHGGLLLLLAALLGLSAPARAEDDPPGRVGRVAELRGTAWVQEPGSREWDELLRNRPVTTGDRLRSDRNGRVEVRIGSSTVRLDENSELEVMRLDDERIDLLLHTGSAALRVRQPEVVFETSLRTQDGSFQPRSPGHYRVDRLGRGTFVNVLSGELQFDGRDSALPLKAGQRAELWTAPEDGATHYTWVGLPADEFDRWVRADDARDDQRLAQQRRYVSPEMTGMEDLDGQGRWETHPEYGPVWSPSQVSVGWAPYRHGRWAWVRPWGWTWIDDAPWGFAPFHYGRWVFWSNRWCWTPGRYVHRPVYAPALVGWVGSPGVNVSISIGHRPGGHIGWVPLGPREVYHPHYRVSPRYENNLNGYPGTVPRYRPDPGQPVQYVNRGAPGGVTVVGADTLGQRRTIMPVPVPRSNEREEWRSVVPPQPIGGGERGGDRGGREPGPRPVAPGFQGGGAAGQMPSQPGMQPGTQPSVPATSPAAAAAAAAQQAPWSRGAGEQRDDRFERGDRVERGNSGRPVQVMPAVQPQVQPQPQFPSQPQAQPQPQPQPQPQIQPAPTAPWRGRDGFGDGSAAPRPERPNPERGFPDRQVQPVRPSMPSAQMPSQMPSPAAQPQAQMPAPQARPVVPSFPMPNRDRAERGDAPERGDKGDRKDNQRVPNNRRENGDRGN